MINPLIPGLVLKLILYNTEYSIYCMYSKYTSISVDATASKVSKWLRPALTVYLFESSGVAGDD